MIIFKKRIVQRKEINFQRSYNLVNTTIPLISTLSIVLGGGTSFIYLKTLNASDLLYSFNFMSFSMLAIFWFIVICYVYMFMYSISFFSINFVNKVKSRDDVYKKSKGIICYYASISIVLFLFLLHLYRVYISTDNYSYWFNGVIIFVAFLFLLCFFYSRLEVFYSGSFGHRIISHLFIGFYPPVLMFFALFFIFKISKSESYLYLFSLCFVLFIFSIIGNFILLDLKDRGLKDIVPKFFITFLFMIFVLAITSSMFNTNFTYTLFYAIGKADSYEKPYQINNDFIKNNGIDLVPTKGDVFCGKLMLNTGEIVIFNQSLSIDKKSKYYRIPRQTISLYQGDVSCNNK